MSDDVVFEDPFNKPIPNLVKSTEELNLPKPTGEILRLKMGQKIECECGKCQVDRDGDRYIIHRGAMYHHRDSASEWLICPDCDDRIKIHPIVEYMDVDAKGDHL